MSAAIENTGVADAPKSFSIAIERGGVEVFCNDNQTLLDCCIQSGLSVPYNCRSGECGECKAVCVSGAVREMPGADPAVFDDTDRAAGKILLCMCTPLSDVVIDVPAATDIPAIRPQTFNVMIARSEKVTPTTWRISVETPGPVNFHAGQYFEWVLPDIAPNRVYSVANAPDGGCIDFLVRIYPDGKVGSHIQQHFSVGGTFSIVGPFGHFTLSRNDWRPAVCVAGGTGLAPMLSVLSEAAANGDRRRFIFFFGARNREELCCLDQIEKLSRQLPSFAFVPVLSDEPAGSDWRGERGMVTDVLARRISDLFGLEAYLCGPPAMIDAALEVLDAAGVPPQDIRVDRFAPAK